MLPSPRERFNIFRSLRLHTGGLGLFHRAVDPIVDKANTLYAYTEILRQLLTAEWNARKPYTVESLVPAYGRLAAEETLARKRLIYQLPKNK